MKNLTFIFLLLSFSSYAQNRIIGIGPFKIKLTTIKIIDSLAEKIGDFKPVYESLEAYSMNNYECKYNEKEKYNSPTGASACSDIRTFFIKNILISGIKFDNVYLFFFKDSLYEFSSDFNKEVEDAMTVKYGSPKVEVKKKTITCTYKLTGNNFKEQEESYYYTWEDKKNDAFGGISLYYNDKCEKSSINFFSVCNKGFTLKKEKLNREYEALKNKENIKGKAASLTDF